MTDEVVEDTARRIKQGFRRTPLEYDVADIRAELERLLLDPRDQKPPSAAYQFPRDGKPYSWPCGCRGEASARPGWLDHYACPQHMAAAEAAVGALQLRLKFVGTLPADWPAGVA